MKGGAPAGRRQAPAAVVTTGRGGNGGRGMETARRSCTDDLAALVGPLLRRRRGTLQPRGGCACPRRARGAEKKMKKGGKEARRPGPGRRRRRRRGAGNWVGGVERGRPNIDDVILMLEIGIPFFEGGGRTDEIGTEISETKSTVFFFVFYFFPSSPFVSSEFAKISLSPCSPLFQPGFEQR